MKKFLRENLIYLIIIIVILCLKIFVITPVRVKGRSMLQTLQNNDVMILNKLAYKNNDIKRFDIVVINEPNEYIIKRVIGLPGEKIEYKNNELYVNGKKINEKFPKIKHTKKDGNEIIALDNYNTSLLGSMTVPEGYYFVLGDNRAESADSRVLGFIKKENIIGKTKYTIFPFDRFGAKK